jgi:hypothetical protein
MHLQRGISIKLCGKKIIFCWHLGGHWRKEQDPDPVLDPDAVSQRYGSKDPDKHPNPYQNVKDPEFWLEPWLCGFEEQQRRRQIRVQLFQSKWLTGNRLPRVEGSPHPRYTDWGYRESDTGEERQEYRDKEERYKEKAKRNWQGNPKRIIVEFSEVKDTDSFNPDHIQTQVFSWIWIRIQAFTESGSGSRLSLNLETDPGFLLNLDLCLVGSLLNPDQKSATQRHVSGNSNCFHFLWNEGGSYRKCRFILGPLLREGFYWNYHSFCGSC